MNTAEQEILDQKKLRGMRLGRIAGIGIYLDWSWLGIFLLVLWNVSDYIVPRAAPQGSVVLYMAVGVGAVAVFLASIILHKLAHVLAARRAGVPLRRADLFFFGGIASLDRDPMPLDKELHITAAGPLASLILGTAFLFAGYAGQIPPLEAFINPQTQAAGSTPISAALQWLGAMNILVALLNILPGFPLDGGRLLFTYLRHQGQDARQATRWTLNAGQVISIILLFAGSAMVLGASLPLLGTGTENGMWLAVAGWFLLTSPAHTSPEQKAQEDLEGLPVERIMRRGVPVSSPAMPVNVFLEEQLMKSDEPAFPVVYHGKLVGLVTLNDVQGVPRDKWESKRLAEIMLPRDKMPIISPDTDVMEALHRMTARKIPQMAVLQGSRLVGMLVYADIVKEIRRLAGQASVGAALPAESRHI